jgi:hypothetical protein
MTTPQTKQQYPVRMTQSELAALVQSTANIVDACQRTTAATAAALHELVLKLESHTEHGQTVRS